MIFSTTLLTLATSTLLATTSHAHPTEAVSHANLHRRIARRQHHPLVPAKRSTGGFFSIGYFVNWGIYTRNFFPSDIPVGHLSHVLYSFANIQSNGTVILSDSWADVQKPYPGDDTTQSGNNVYGNFKQLLLLKQQNRHLKVSLSIGGWSYRDNFANMVDATYRANFVQSSVQMVEDYGLDGIDIDVEYPTASNVESYYQLLAAIRKGLNDLASQTKTTPFLLSIAVSAGSANYAPLEPFMPQINSVVDMVNVMAYDYCTATGQATACDVANLKGGSTNTATAVAWYLAHGVTPSKLVMGEPLYGYAYSGTTGHDQPFTGNPPGDYGALGTYDYKDLPLGTNPQITQDTNNVASWSYDSASKTLASYDTTEIAAEKAQWLLQQNLGGAMFWELSGDKTDNSDSLVYQFYSAFMKRGGLESSCNHVYYPNSNFDNIKNGLGKLAASCDGDGGKDGYNPASSSSSSMHASTATSSTKSTTASTSTTSRASSTSSSSTASGNASAPTGGSGSGKGNGNGTGTGTGTSNGKGNGNGSGNTTGTGKGNENGATNDSGNNNGTGNNGGGSGSGGGNGVNPSYSPGSGSTSTGAKGNSGPLPDGKPPANSKPPALGTTRSLFVPCSSHASKSKTCKKAKVWQRTKTYKRGTEVQCNDKLYKANWEVTARWSQSDRNRPYPTAKHTAWKLVKSC